MIPVILGPTASGKSAAAFAVASRHGRPIEIISADSRQVYRRLSIGTGKPTAAEQAKVPHHLIDLIEPGEQYSAARFLSDAAAAISDCLGRGCQPLVVGGTGLYVRALTDGLIELDDAAVALRQEIEHEVRSSGAERAWELLQLIDPLEAAKVHPNNTVRIVRALALHRQTGRSKSELIAAGQTRRLPYSFEVVVLEPPDRAWLYGQIESRIDQMMKSGWVEEVEQLVADGLGEQIARSSVIGYGELLEVISGKINLPEALVRIKQETRRYAKRQLTWNRHQVSGLRFSESERLADWLVARLAEPPGVDFA